MIFESLKILRICNRLKLSVEELFLIQTVHDYQYNLSILNREIIKELEIGYLEYYSKKNNIHNVNWKEVIEKLIENDWLIDNRIDRNKFKINELSLSDKFKKETGSSSSDEELFEVAKSIYPKVYKTGYNSCYESFRLSPKEENELLKIFKSKILSGNRKDNFNEFYYITSEKFKEVEYAQMSFEKYLNSFRENKESYRKEIE